MRKTSFSPLLMSLSPPDGDGLSRLSNSPLPPDDDEEEDDDDSPPPPAAPSGRRGTVVVDKAGHKVGRHSVVMPPPTPLPMGPAGMHPMGVGAALSGGGRPPRMSLGAKRKISHFQVSMEGTFADATSTLRFTWHLV